MLKQEAEILKKVHKLNSAIQNLRLVASGGFPDNWESSFGLCFNLIEIENTPYVFKGGLCLNRGNIFQGI